MKRYSLKIKEIELQLHDGNYNRRVRYNEKDFDILVISFKEKTDLIRKFAISANCLPNSDSIHLIFDPNTHKVSFSPQEINTNIISDVEKLLCSDKTCAFMVEDKEQYKKSIRFFNDREVKAVWDEEHSKWWFSVLDIIAAINEQDDYQKTRNYWKYLKTKLRKENSQLVSATNQLKLKASDGKFYKTDTFDAEGISLLAKHINNTKATSFLDWFLYSDNTIDGQSKKKAYQLFESGILQTAEPGSLKCLQQIHAYLFGGLYDFAGQIRTKNISKGGFTFANCMHFPETLQTIERMPETTFDEIMDKYVEMKIRANEHHVNLFTNGRVQPNLCNVAHPFMEGNGRSTRIWLDLMLKRSLKRCVDWSQIDKNDYLSAMRESVSDSTHIKVLVLPALTTKIDDREMFMQGIDYSYCYEQKD